MPDLSKGLQGLKSNFKGGSRSNLYEVHLNFPTSIDEAGAKEASRFLIKATSIPASTVGVVPVPYKGRVLNVAGDRTFEPWSITVINDEDMEIRIAFEKWMDYVNRHTENTSISSKLDDYTATMEVKHLSREGKVTASYKFECAWPSSLGAIELGYENNDAIEEFEVELQYQWWENSETTT